jgi:hypothetical protein
MPTKKSAAEKKSAVNNDREVVHAVPTAGDRETPVRKTSKVIDRFKSKVKPNTKEVKPADRPVVDIDEETQEKFINFAATKELFDIFEADKKAQTEGVYSAIMDRYKASLWKSKSQPKNPAIKVLNKQGKVEAEGLFIVTVGSKIKINMPEVGEEEAPEDVMIRSLVDLGVSQTNAENLVSNEVSFVPQWSLNFTDMLHGVYSEGSLKPASDLQISASEILFQVINGLDEDGNVLSDKSRVDMLKKITESGWSAIKENVDSHTKYFPQLVDGAKFLDRVCNYANSFEELNAIMTMFVPVHFCRSVKFAVSDSHETKVERLIDEARAKIAGSSDVSDEEIKRSYES